MILATRSTQLDRWLHGLDKCYRLHKWLGIAALVGSVAHWVFINWLSWAIALGVMEATNRQRPTGDRPEVGAVQTFFNSQRGTAEMLGEWAFYATVVLIAIALTRRIPYRLFAKIHTLIAVAYLILVYHGVVLMDFEAWFHPIGIVTALLMIGGVIVALLALTRQIGRRRQVGGRIAEIRKFPSMQIMGAEIAINSDWPGHRAGQFAFVTFDKKEGAHPFTIASAWDASAPSITFISKALGDYTERMPSVLSAGDDVTVEGPYGHFTFDDGKDRQIWIGAGIGITPFIARMRHLAMEGDGKQIDLIHVVPEIAPEARALLETDVAAAGIDLHLMRDAEEGRLSGTRLREMVPEWNMASVWFCGPSAFGQALREDLVTHGLHPSDFHQELFNMR